MSVISQSLSDVELMRPQVHRNLALFPLVSTSDTAPTYLLLDDALEQGLASVTEVSAEGSVPELAFENAAAVPILLVDGDELVGAKQNRIVNLSILVGGHTRLVIPVSCVEQGRWSYRSNEFRPTGRALFAKARRRKMESVSNSMRERGARQSNQSEVWQDVEAKMSQLRTESPTMSMGDVYEKSEADLRGFVEAFRVEKGQRGAVTAIDGKVAGIELFDSSATFARYLRKLLNSYALDAIETVDKPVNPPELAEVRAFLRGIEGSAIEQFKALGEGEDLRLSGDHARGGALLVDGRVVHLAGFAG